MSPADHLRDGKFELQRSVEMKVTVYQWEDNYDGTLRQELHIDGKDVEHVGSLYECPEDAIVERSLISCSDISHYMKKAVDTVKNGEDVIFEFIKKNPNKED